MTTKADEALEKAKKDAEEAQTAAASAAANPGKPAPAPAPPAQAKVAPPITKVVAPPPKPAGKPRQSIVQIKFNEGMRDVEIEFVKDEGTMTPRKIEFALKVLYKKYREHLGKAQAAEARKQREIESKKADATK